MKMSWCCANEHGHASEGVDSLRVGYRLDKHGIVEVHNSNGLGRASFKQTASVNTRWFNCRGQP
jgi:hypothetical protein